MYTNVQGLNYSSLGLIEMIAPRNPSAKEINRPENGSSWVAAHESGHSADTREYANRLSRDTGIRSKLFGGNRYTSSNAWLNQASGLFKTMNSELQPTNIDKIKEKLRINRKKSSWELEYDQIDNNGKHVTTTETVDQLPRQIRANRIWRTGFPTAYSRTKPGELYAESFASALSGIGTNLPFRTKTIDGFAAGARINKRLHSLIEQTTDTTIDNNGTTTPVNSRIDNQTITVYDKPENNLWYAHLKRRSVITAHPGDDNLVGITTRVRSSKKV